MKALKIVLTVYLALFALPSCQAIEQATLSSPVLDSTTALAESGLDNVYLTLSVKNKGFYAGFRITADGINHPLVVEVDMMSKTTKEWEFDEIISDLFIYENRVSLLLDNGGLF